MIILTFSDLHKNIPPPLEAKNIFKFMQPKKSNSSQQYALKGEVT